MEQQDKFLEYCSGKVFLLSWTARNSGVDYVDRWLTFGSDAVMTLNYIKSATPCKEEYSRFEPNSMMNQTDYLVCSALNGDTHIDEISGIVGEVVTVKRVTGVHLIQCVVDHVNKAIGEHYGN